MARTYYPFRIRRGERSDHIKITQGNLLTHPFLLKRSVIAVALTLVSVPAVMAQQLASEQSLTKVTITGSNLKRADKEGTSPIEVLTAKDIKASGANTVAELMRQVPSMGTDTNRDFEGGSGFARGVATASLRGLSSTSTLILINGRRMARRPTPIRTTATRPCTT